MPRITVNGRIIEVPEGRTILQALDDVGLLMNGVESVSATRPWSPNRMS